MNSIEKHNQTKNEENKKNGTQNEKRIPYLFTLRNIRDNLRNTKIYTKKSRRRVASN